MKHWVIAISLMILGGGMSACAMGGTSWKEEALLHDGRKILVERNLMRKGRHEPFQRPAIGEQRLSFTLPATKRQDDWIEGGQGNDFIDAGADNEWRLAA